MKTIVTQAMHKSHSNGRWFDVPADMGKNYKSLPGWQVRELVDLADAVRAVDLALEAVTA